MGKNTLSKWKKSVPRNLPLLPQQCQHRLQQLAPAQPEPVSTPEPEVAPQPAPGTLPADGEPIHSPMPGTILRLLVNVGDTVQENQSLMILEAMKMENEIVAPKAGTVVAIAVNAGDMVNPGELLITIG